MTPAHRATVIDAFTNQVAGGFSSSFLFPGSAGAGAPGRRSPTSAQPHISVFLISLKAGGVALNLTAASRVYLMDPWWNPAAESQAAVRVCGRRQPLDAVLTPAVARTASTA